jgi:hypothetical protein
MRRAYLATAGRVKKKVDPADMPFLGLSTQIVPP